MNNINITASLDDAYYYVRNFEFVLDWLNSHYFDLLSPEELRFLELFSSLALAEKALLVRLLMRKPTVFRVQCLHYPEVPSVVEAIDRLEALGLLKVNPELSIEELGGLLTKEEFSRAFRLTAVQSKASKKHLIAMLREICGEPRSWVEWTDNEFGAAICVSVQKVCDALRVMFFGNDRQGWEEFILSELGVRQYEPVVFQFKARAFSVRQDFDSFLALLECANTDTTEAEALSGCINKVQAIQAVAPWIMSKKGRELHRLAYRKERSGDYDEALSLYELAQDRDSRIRQIRILERQERWEEALIRAKCVLEHPRFESESQQVLRILPRLERHTGEARRTKKQRRTFHEALMDVSLLPGDERIEKEAAVLLSSSKEVAYYVENHLFCALFTLLFWDQIYADIEGAFFQPFQSAPADLFQESFYKLRRAEIDRRMHELDGNLYLESVMNNYRNKHGLQVPLFSWQVISRELLELALMCVPAQHLKFIFSRMLFDMKANTSGFPDLVRLQSDGSGYELIEVKGPGDKLQDNQVRWLDFFERNHIPASVAVFQKSG